MKSGESFIEQLKRQRKALKLTQAGLGKRTGLPQSHISKIESGGVDPQLSNFVEIARSLELEPILVPRAMVPIVESILRGDDGEDNEPLYKPWAEEDV